MGYSGEDEEVAITLCSMLDKHSYSDFWTRLDYSLIVNTIAFLADCMKPQESTRESLSCLL